MRIMRKNINKYQQMLDVDRRRLDQATRDELIVRYAPLVKQIADRMAIRLPQSISQEELASAGVMGLIDALDKFDSEMGIKFKSYAEHRIKGAMLDELRKMDWVPRSVRRDIRKIEETITKLEHRLSREAEDYEVAKEMGVDIASYYAMIDRARGGALLSLNQITSNGGAERFGDHSDTPSPLDNLKIKELKDAVAHAILTLAKKEQLVISLYYYDLMTLKEIGEIMGLTESRICQVHSKAVIRLRAKLSSYYES
jgi:RNA polymerase sigma factor for flagellar operon FliA